MNNKIISLITACVITAFPLLTGCEKPVPEGADYSFDYALTGNPESLDPQVASDINSLNVIENLFTGLMKWDISGSLQNAIAKDYSISDDGLTYTFTLRDDCFWFYDSDEDEEIEADEVTPVTAYDFEFAFKRLFNPETRSPHREKYKCLKNASNIISGSTDYNEIGVKAVSDTELIFTLEYPFAGFLSSLAMTPSMPCNKQFFTNTKGRYGLDDRSIESNGAFFIRQWFYDYYGNDNFIYMARNLKNDNFDRIYPTNLNFYIKNKVEQTEQAFEEGTSDVLLSFVYDDQKYEENEYTSFYNYTFGFIVNPESKYANNYIRKALAYGIDKDGLSEGLPDDMTAAYGIIPPGVSFLNKGYREINADKAAAISSDDGKLIKYDTEKAKEYYKRGMEQMNLQSLENIKILILENSMDTEFLHYVTQNWQSLFGFYAGIEEANPEDYYSRIEDGEYVLALYPVSGDYNSPTAVLEQFTTGNNQMGYSNTNLDRTVDELNMLTSFNDGVELYNKAEKTILNDFEFIPLFYKKQFQIMGKGNHDIVYDPFTKHLNFRYAKYYE